MSPEETTEAPLDRALPPRPQPTGDRERDALELGFWGCRVMGTRIVPSMSGRTVLRATLAASGRVVNVIAEEVENLPRAVVQCLIDRVANAEFDRRGYESVLLLPVDFTVNGQQPAQPTIFEPLPTQSL